MDKLYVIYVDPGGEHAGMTVKHVTEHADQVGPEVERLLRDYVHIEVFEVDAPMLERAREDAWT